jgi:hypothetical protein
MILDLPQLGPVQFDDNLTEEQLMAQVDALSKKYGIDLAKSELTSGEMASRAFTRGTKRLGSAFGDIIPAMAASALGFEDYAKRQLGEAAATEAEIQRYYRPQYPDLESVKGIGDFPGFALETIAEQVPNIATSLIPGVGAGALAARAGAGMAGKMAAANAGVFLGSYAQNAPEVFQNIYDKTGQLETGTSLLFGAASAALDSVLPATLARQLTGPTRVGVIEKILEKSGMDKGLLRGATAGILKGVGTEGLTEGAQEAISITAENFVANNPQIFQSPEWNRIMEASVRGAVAGGAFGGVGGGLESARAGMERKRQEAEELARQGREEEAAALRRQAEADQAEIDALEKLQPQMTLPGIEVPGYATQIIASKAAVDAQNSLKGKQLSFFDEEGKLTSLAEKAATADQKRAANVARQKTQQQAADLKAAQEKLKKFLSSKQLTLPGMSPEELAAAQQQQAAVKAQAVATGQGDLFAAPPAPAVAPAPAAIPEPTKVTPPSGLEGTIISSNKDGLTALGKQLGIGRTAKILRPDGPLAGKDLSDPVQAAEVRRILEAYASGKPAEGATAKIEEFLKRPEFQVAETEVTPDERVDTELVGGAVEPSVPSDITGREAVGDLGAPGVGAPVVGGLGEAGLPAERPAEGAGVVEPALGVKAAKDVAKAEAATGEAIQRQADFITQNDERANNALTGMLREAAADADIDPDLLPSEDLTGTPAHNYLRLPGLLNEYFRLKDVLARPALDPAGQAQDARNQQELDVIRDAILQSGPDMGPFLQEMEAATPKQRNSVLSNITKEAKTEFQSVIEEKIAQAQQAGVPAAVEKPAAPATPEQASRLEKIAAAAQRLKQPSREEFISEVDSEKARKAQKAFAEDYEKLTGEKLFLPVHRGPDLNETGRALVESGNLKGLIDNLKASTQNKDVRQILTKIKSLNLKTKIVVGPVEGNQAGSFDPRTNTITISPELGMNEHTVLHELMHAAISHVLRNENLPVSKELIQMFGQLRNQLGAAYGGQDIQEFASELVSNPEFQALLKTLKAPRSGSMFQRFVQTLAEFFGFSKGTNAYERGMKLVNDALDISGDVKPEPADLMFLGTPNGQRAGFRGVGEIGQSMPLLNNRMAESVANMFSNTPSTVTYRGMGLLRLDNINTIYGKDLPALQNLLDALERRNGSQERAIEQINTKFKRFRKVYKENTAAFERMQDMAYDARLAQVDVLDPNFKPSPSQMPEYNKLKAIYSNLPKSVQDTYRTIRADYDNAIDQYENLLLSAVTPSLAAKLKAEFQARKRQISYIPFLRRGEYWVEYEENGERAASAFESIRERDRFVKEVLQGKDHRLYQNIQNATFQQGTLPPTSFIVRVMNDLNQQGASQSMKDSVYQAYLALFPGQSIAKNFMKSDNVRGMERDIIRGYDETMIKWARKLADSEYNPQIDRALNEVGVQAQNSGRPDLTAVAQNVLDQRDFLHNPTFNGLTHTATTVSYFAYIAGNISSALVNLSTLPMFSWSVLGGRFGFGEASSSLLNASKTTINYIFSNKVPQQYRALFDVLNDHGQLQHTLAREALEGRRQATSDYTGVKAQIMDLISSPFHKTEVLNRGATAIAAYDLALKGNPALGIKPMNQQDAIRYALKTVKDINTSAMAATAPRYMQSGLGRVFFTFKSFVWNSAFVVARAFHQAVLAKNIPPEVQREARRQLLGIMGMATALGGVNALPFMGVASTTANMIHALFGDDDEPFDFDTEMRNMFGDLVYKGALNYALNLEISNRIGVAQDLIFRDDPRSVAEHGYVLTAMKQAFGPVGSLIAGTEQGFKAFEQGETLRGLESMVPSFVRNAFKAWRFAQEGATNLKGEPIVDDISAYNVAMQLIGFSPAHLSNAYEEIGMKKDYERKILARRNRLLDKYDMARKAGDSELLTATQAEIDEYNAARQDPKARITRETLLRSERARKAAEENSIRGVRFNKNLLPELNELVRQAEE